MPTNQHPGWIQSDDAWEEAGEGAGPNRTDQFTDAMNPFGPALPPGTAIRRARLYHFPDIRPQTGNGVPFPAGQATWGEGWVVESQIAPETVQFGVEDEERVVPAQNIWPYEAPPDLDFLAPELKPVFGDTAPLSAMFDVTPPVPGTASQGQPAPAPGWAEESPPLSERTQLVEYRPLSPAAVAAPLPESAFRALSPAEAEYISWMRRWLNDEAGKPGNTISQLSADEQIQQALEALNGYLARRLQSQVTPNFADMAQAYLMGWGPLNYLMKMEEVTEVMVNGAVSIYIERSGRLEPVGPGLDDETIYTIVERMTGQRPTLAEPMIDERLKDGSRLNATHHSISLLGAALSIRRHPQRPLSAGDLLQNGALTQQALRFLDGCVRGRLNMVVSGGTNTGKTTLLNVLLGCIPSTERLVIIEQAPAEIHCSLKNRAHLLTRPRTADGAAEVSVIALVRNALRMRPDRIVVGESRGAEALAMLQAMNTGHAGSLTTLHANNPLDALARLETMALMAESGLPHDAIRSQIGRAIQIIIQTRRDPAGRRFVHQIAQVLPSRDSVTGYSCSSLFEARPEQGFPLCRRTRTALDQSLTEQMLSYGVRPEEFLANSSAEPMG